MVDTPRDSSNIRNLIKHRNLRRLSKTVVLPNEAHSLACGPALSGASGHCIAAAAAPPSKGPKNLPRMSAKSAVQNAKMRGSMCYASLVHALLPVHVERLCSNQLASTSNISQSLDHVKPQTACCGVFPQQECQHAALSETSVR